jgi:hypothetical protein
VKSKSVFSKYVDSVTMADAAVAADAAAAVAVHVSTNPFCH